jgi:hypothetical protein
LIKNVNLLSLGLGLIKDVKATGEASPSKVNIQLGPLLASWIRILPTKINADPDPAFFVSDLQDANKN